MSSVLSLLLVATLPQQPPRPVHVEFVNSAPVERAGIVTVSVPFPRGELVAAATASLFSVDVTIAGERTVAPAVELMRWPDGSIELLQVHARCTLPPRGRVEALIAPRLSAEGQLRPLDVAADALPRPAGRMLDSGELPLWTELLDPWGRVLRADLVPDSAAGPAGVVFDSGAVRLRQYRASFVSADSGGPAGALFDLTAWLLTFADERRGELTLVLDNREPEVGPLGPVRFRGCRIMTADDRLRFLPAFASENLIPRPRPRDGGGFVQWLVRPGDSAYLGAFTAKAFRLHLFEDGDDVTAEDRQQAVWATARSQGFCDVAAVRASGAFGSHGGPAPLAGDGHGDAGRQLELWRRTARFGPFAGFGDPEDSTISGSPRHGDSLLHNALRWRSTELLFAAEAMVLQHGLRPDGGRAVPLPAATEAYRRGLGPLARQFPHGFVSIDYEHVSAHLLFDYWWLTGDPWARDELGRVGRSILRLLATVPFRTSRGEGHCLEAGTLCALATADAELLEALVVHAHREVLPLLEGLDGGVAIAQPPHPEVLDGRSSFDAVWQMAQLVRGLAALAVAAGDADIGAACVQVADAMGRAGWVDGAGPKTFVSAGDRGRYSLAASPLDQLGSVRMTISAFELAAELAGDPEEVAFLRGRAESALRIVLPLDAELPERSLARSNPWLQVVFDRREKRRAN